MMVDMWKFERKYCFIGLGTIQDAVKLYHRASRRHAQVEIEEQLDEMWVEGADGEREIVLCDLPGGLGDPIWVSVPVEEDGDGHTTGSPHGPRGT
jgi:hypothetical protein